MFTSVDSNRKKLEHLSNENVQVPQSLNNSIIKESKSGIFNQIDHLLSINDEYTKLQLTIFGITFVFSILLASITGFFLGFTFGFSIFIGAIAGIFYFVLQNKIYEKSSF